MIMPAAIKLNVLPFADPHGPVRGFFYKVIRKVLKIRETYTLISN